MEARPKDLERELGFVCPTSQFLWQTIELILILKAAKACRITLFITVFPKISSWMSLEARWLGRAEQLGSRSAPELCQNHN